jgi:Flp pilus assembly pilin Flp
MHNRRIRGQGMSEYLIITALIAVAGIGIFAAFGDTIQNQVAAMSQELSGQDGGDAVGDAQESADAAVDRAAETDNLSNYTENTNSE